MNRRMLCCTVLLLLALAAVPATWGQESTPEPAPAPVLEVTDTLPEAGTADVDPSAGIIVVFNRPVVPLGTIEENAALPGPLRFTPALQGTGEWVNTAIYRFTPDPGLAGGTDYTVRIAPDLRAVDGAALAGPYAFSFTTAVPAITGLSPAGGDTGVALDRSVQVVFSMPVDRAAAEAAFALAPFDAPDATVAGRFDWQPDSTAFRFIPDERLALGTIYQAQISGGSVTASGGGRPMAADTVWQFETVPLPAIISTTPRDGERGVRDFYTGLQIFFASPMDISSFAGRITVHPPPAREYDGYYSDWDNSYTLAFEPEPSTPYTITIAPGLRDIYGNAIEEMRVIRYTTESYDPMLQLQTSGPIGFYNADSAQTQLFATARNLASIDLALYRVPVPQAVSVFQDNYWSALDSLALQPEDVLRRWSVDLSDVPLNALRYELLSLGGGAAQSCEGAPPSRLNVGDVARVVSDPDPVRARSAPGTGEIIDLLYRDYRLPVIGGPECLDGLLWWQVQLRDERSAWVAEGTGDEYFLDVALGGESPAVAYTGEGGSLLPGVYVLLAQSTPNTGTTRHMLIVGNATLTMYSAADQVSVWATDVQSGQPLANVPIRVYDSAGQIGSARTDADGLAVMPVPPAPDYFATRYAVLDDGGHFGITFNRWTDGIDPYYFGVPVETMPQRYTAYLYTDRPVYRPGQPVYFRGIMRETNELRYLPPGVDQVDVEIVNDANDVVYSETLHVNEWGSFSGELALADDASLGNYRIIAQMPGQQRDLWRSPQVAFAVAEYRAPEFQVNLTPEAAEVVQNSTIAVTVDARYFFGGAVSGGTVAWSAISTPYAFAYDGAGGYSFEDIDSDAGPSEMYYNPREEIASGEGVLDDNGQFVIRLPAELQDASRSATFTIEATVSDESGLAVAGRADVIVHKGDVYVGVAPESYVASAGEETAVQFITVDWDSQPVAGQALQIDVVERRWSSVQEQDEYGRTTWSYDVEDIPVTTGEVTTDEAGRARFTFVPPAGGSFRVRATVRDSQGSASSSASYVWVSSGAYVSWRQQNSNRIDLIASQNEYAIGDTAEILITSPFQGKSEALVVVQRGRLLQTERITLTSNSYVYRLPITEDYAPNVFVGVFIVHGVDDNNPVAGFRTGLVQLNVERERKALTVEILPDSAQAGPGDTVRYTVRVTDWLGQPVGNAEVGIGLSDLATLSISSPNSGLLLDTFYGLQGLAVGLATPLTISTDQITQTILDTIKGGGGGFGEGGIFDIRQQFVDTPYWNPSVITGADGRAQFSLVLPDTLTTWRLDARAVTLGADGDFLVGQATDDIISTLPVLIRPVTPRFLIVDDQVTLAAIVNNNTDSAQTVEVTLQGAGIRLADGVDRLQQVVIPAGGRQRVEWPAIVEAVDAVDLTFFASADDGAYTDAAKPPLGQGDARLLPVYRYTVPQTTATAGAVPAGDSRTEAIVLPTGVPVSEGTLDIRLEPSLAAGAISALGYLENFPHQCVEQTVSRFLPNIVTLRALTALGIDNPDLRAGLEDAVSQALQMLASQQKVDGGWGWFPQDVSNPLVTAYALLGLTAARAQDYPVSDSIIDGAIRYLRQTLGVASRASADWQLNRQVFIGYALAEAGAPNAASAANLYELRGRLDLYAQALLALTLRHIDPQDARIATLMSDLASQAVLSATGAYWDEAQADSYNWNSDTRATAIALYAFTQIAPDNPLLPNVVRWLMSARTADAWETTQETAWSVMALSAWMLASGERGADYAYVVSLNDRALGEGAVDAGSLSETRMLQADVSALLRDAANTLVFSTTGGAGTLYYTAALNLRLPVDQVQPVDRGIILQRQYVRQDAPDGGPIQSAAVGENVQVRLTIIVPDTLHYVVIEDPIPAGTDAVNPELLTSQQIGTQPSFGPSDDPLSQGWGWWWFSSIEFRDEKVVLYASTLPAGTYEFVYTLRAGLPGVYNVIPATGQEFYFPEVYGRSAGAVFTITP
jgi:uncharacterized protein YfaS (alpha-2-macroglobulin family)